MRGSGEEMLAGLRDAAARQAARNAMLLKGPPEKQWWNLPAKIRVARQIAREENARFAGHHNDEQDALRHARTSQRLAQRTGPIFTSEAGVGHELIDLHDDVRALIDHRLHPERFPPGWAPPSLGQTVSEMRMDMRNNDEGVAAAREGRPINRAALQKAP